MKFILLFIIALMLGCLNVVYAASTYKHFEDYTDIKMMSSPGDSTYCSPQAMRCIYTGKEKINSRTDNPLYDENKWYLILRHSLYQAQVEKAMSEIYAYFMGYATDVEIVEDEGNYYIASRAFKNFIDFNHFNPAGNQIQQAAGGFGQISAIADFFGDGDFAGDNFGVQITDNAVRAIKIDNAAALLFEDDDQDRESMNKDLSDSELGQEILNSADYKKEKQAMFEKIAATDFSVIENIIRNNITVSRLKRLYWELERYEGPDKAELINKLQQSDPKEFEVDELIKQLRLRCKGLLQSSCASY